MTDVTKHMRESKDKKRPKSARSKRLEFNCCSFEEEHRVADTVVCLPSREEIRAFFNSHVVSEYFGPNTHRNTPENADMLASLKASMQSVGVLEPKLTIVVSVQDEVAQVLRNRVDGGGELILPRLQAHDPEWKAVLIDGYHRRQALLSLLDESTTPLSLDIRVVWLKENGSATDYRK